jgi:cytochrome c556
MRRAILVLGLALMAAPAAAQDVREIIPMPDDIRQDMLVAMRDHMVVLDTVFSHLATERYREAATLAESRLQAAPFDSEKEKALLPYFNDDMKDSDGQLREQGRRLGAAIRKLETERSYAAAKSVSAAVSDVTTICVSCHAKNRLR